MTILRSIRIPRESDSIASDTKMITLTTHIALAIGVGGFYGINHP
jgi:hypothetical protein